MKTLIITVGTRQVGWLCRDRIIRCFGADGDRNEYPRHIDQLFQELGVERGIQEGQAWGVRELSRHYYNHCRENLQEGFSSVELLLDHQVIEDQYSQGLTHVVLWGTNQPETTPWLYRNKDTRWLAHLMAGKIRQTWPELVVEVFEPIVDANDNPAIREALEAFLLGHTQQLAQEDEQAEFTLLIQSKGAVPAIAQSLEICSAGLVRQFQVFSVIPIEPVPLFSPETQSSNRSTQNQVISIGEYFWPIERLRIVSAWQRGDFHEAAFWLVAHQSRYRQVYRLAKCLTLATNWQLETFFQHKNRGISQWLSMDSLNKVAEPLQIEAWKAEVEHIRSSPPAQAWESSFLLYLLLLQGNYTDAFMRFAQTLERLLYLRSEEEGWFRSMSNGRHPGFKQLIDQWAEVQGMTSRTSIYQEIDRIRNTRNQVVHNAKPMTLKQIMAIWARSAQDDNEVLEENKVFYLMTKTLRQVCSSHRNIPEETLFNSLYSWGLASLQAG